ncbi:hypothetical protein H0H93_000739 [Arthromyces matolae]|nr:hypothetical protein H0H93_000739 [Arthromyces matolae]
MPTTLPLVTSPIIKVPPQPSDPPSKRDITGARCLPRDTLVPYNGRVNEDAKEQQVISEYVEGPAEIFSALAGQTVVDESHGFEKFLNSEAFTAIITKAVEDAVKSIREELNEKINERFGKINEKLDKINERLENIVEGLGVNNNNNLSIAIQRSSYRARGRPPSLNSY